MNIPKKNSGMSRLWKAVFVLAGLGLLLLYGAAVLVVVGTLWLTLVLLKKMFWG